MPKAFISYSDVNRDKVMHLKLLLENTKIEPIIIANRKEPSKSLSQKVEKGIEESDFFIPILTRDSIHTQWINQEIGYARCFEVRDEIKIIPIVEEAIMKDLTGFVHIQKDLPFSFKGSDSRRIENYLFKKTSKVLIAYLETLPDDKGNVKIWFG